MQQDLLNWLLFHYGQEHMRPGLGRIKAALGPLLSELKKMKVITIAGTNGKGETTLRLSSLLKNEPQAVWTSPHIERITERFRSEKGEITLDELKELISECHEKVKHHQYQLSFYEFLFFVFCSWAVKHSPKYLLLEVGLGGRLDAVNALDAELVLLPSISRDHQEFLGNRYDGILKEKLGTLRAGSTLISFLDLRYLRERALREATSVGAKFVDLNDTYLVPAYEFSRRNSILASAAFSFLTGSTLQSESEKTLFPLEHRGEILRDKNEWHFFGSHNPDGMRKLIQFLHSDNYTFSKPPFDSVIVAFSNRNVRDLRVMMRMLKMPGLGNVVVTVFPHPKAASSEVVGALSKDEGLNFVSNIGAYIQNQKDQRVLVAGSYYFMGYFKSLLGCHR